MTYDILDTYTKVVIGTYSSLEQADKAFSRLYNLPGEQRYQIRSPKKPRKNKTDAKKESN
mgnify:FL=1|tara:strand:- start:1119 stop:1298 length:180 start_codon:yes stop_codon:yes gene_type:complete